MHRENRHSLATVESTQALLPELIRLARDVVDGKIEKRKWKIEDRKWKTGRGK